MNVIKTVGDLRKIIEGLDDDFKLDIRVREELPMEEVIKSGYPYPYATFYYDSLEFDDIGWSDKDLCLGINHTKK